MERLAILMILGSALASSALRADEWVTPDGAVRLEFRAEGTYTAVVQGVRSEGRFSERDGQLVLVGSDGSSVTYRVERVSDEEIALVDVLGVAYRFVRVPAAAEDAVLAGSGDLVLRASDFRACCTFAALLLDRPVTDAERERLLAACRRDFPVDPAGFHDQLRQIRQGIEPILATGDALKIAQLQQTLLAEIHLGTRAIPVEARPEIVKLLDEEVRVLAVDEANRLLLTDRAVDAFLALADRAAVEVGQTPLSGAVDRTEFERALAKGFAGMPLETRQGLCSLPVVRRVIEHEWHRLGASERAQIAAAFGAHPGNAPAASPGDAVPSKSIEEMETDRWHRQQMFDMMNRASLQSHALSLNIIENMGGTGNYWEVVDRP